MISTISCLKSCSNLPVVHSTYAFTYFWSLGFKVRWFSGLDGHVDQKLLDEAKFVTLSCRLKARPAKSSAVASLASLSLIHMSLSHTSPLILFKRLRFYSYVSKSHGEKREKLEKRKTRKTLIKVQKTQKTLNCSKIAKIVIIKDNIY